MNNTPTPPSNEPEELAHADDAIIGRATRRSALALTVVAVLVGASIYISKRKPAPPPPQVTQFRAPTVPDKPKAEIPVATFADITREAGITFIHNNGAYGDKLLPETMGGGVAFFDFDNDGAPDLLFINSTYWPWHRPEGKQPTTAALYRNDGKGHFTDVTAGSGLDSSFYGMGVAIGDYDNDGRDDVFVTAVGGNHLFHNEGDGKFKEITATAGVGGSTNDWSTCAAWLDYDNDGKLDLFVGNYVKWSREIDAEVGYKIDGRTRAYGQPNNFEGAFSRLYHNYGNGRFSDASAPAGIQIKNPSTGVPAAKALGVAPVDVDDDGWIDLVVANDTVPNFVFLNQRNGTFNEIGALSGLAFDNFGNTRGAMGIDAARYRNDGRLGIAIGNFANEMTALYVAQNAPTNFADEAITEGVGPPSRLLLKFGVFFFDYDLDGWLDLLTVNGHLEEDIHKIQASQTYRQPAQLFWNAGGTSQIGFLVVPPEKCGQDVFRPLVGRGSAYADIDGDGDLDVVLTQVNGPPMLLRNDQQLPHHWLRLKLIGARCNRDAIGAWVKVRVGSRTLSRQIMPTRGYLSQSELAVTIGLDQAARADEVIIAWPDGTQQKVEQVRVDAMTVVHQGGGTGIQPVK
jgi:enediyne biosynthesis protein E4